MSGFGYCRYCGNDVRVDGGTCAACDRKLQGDWETPAQNLPIKHCRHCGGEIVRTIGGLPACSNCGPSGFVGLMP